eukprot:04535_6
MSVCLFRLCLYRALSCCCSFLTLNDMAYLDAALACTLCRCLCHVVYLCFDRCRCICLSPDLCPRLDRLCLCPIGFS